MRFIHIADVHLGMQPDAGFPWSEERGEAIWESFRRIIRLAGREKTDFLLIAGDLFQRQPLELTSTDIGGTAFRTNSIETRCIARMGASVFDSAAAVRKEIFIPAT